jgi:magnesium transporter
MTMLMGYGLYQDGELVESLPRGSTEIHQRLGRDWDSASSPDDRTFLWIGYADPQPNELSLAATHLSLSDLQIEDALNPAQRPIFEWHGERSGFIVVKTLQYVDETSDVYTGQLAIFFDHSHVVTVRHGAVGPLATIREYVDHSPARVRLGPLSVIHAILDHVVDGYLNVAAGVAQDIAEVEEAVFSPARTDDAATIYRLKRENLEIRRAVLPLYAAAEMFVARTATAIPRELAADFSDVGEHILRVTEQVEAQDALLTSVLTASMSRQSLQQNEDMRKISAWVAIAAMPTMIAGIYGMNFEHMPELSWRLGYPLALGLMASVCAGLWRMFKKSGWL